MGAALLEAERQLTTPLIANLDPLKVEVGEAGAGVLPQRLGQMTTPLCDNPVRSKVEVGEVGAGVLPQCLGQMTTPLRANVVRNKLERGEVGELAQDSVECIPFHPKAIDLDVIQLLETPLQHRIRPRSVSIIILAF